MPKRVMRPLGGSKNPFGGFLGLQEYNGGSTRYQDFVATTSAVEKLVEPSYLPQDAKCPVLTFHLQILRVFHSSSL